jgi:hypothetical protein
MGFMCQNEIGIKGGDQKDREAAAKLILAAESIDEDSAKREEQGDALILRCSSVDGIPEEETVNLAGQFPALSFSIIYFSKDGEFHGFARTGAGGDAAESADLVAADLDEVGKKHMGDGIAFVKERFGLS